MPSSAAYRHRFGSLVRAYQLIGYSPETDYGFIEVNRFLRTKHPQVVQEIISRLSAQGLSIQRHPESELLVVDGELVVSLVLSRCLRTHTGSPRWIVRLEESNRPDITIVARMDENNKSIKDYYLFPALDCLALKLRLADCNPAMLDAFKFPDLSLFYRLNERVSVRSVA